MTATASLDWGLWSWTLAPDTRLIERDASEILVPKPARAELVKTLHNTMVGLSYEGQDFLPKN